MKSTIDKYLKDHKNEELKSLLDSINSHLRTTLSINLNTNANLLPVYNNFLKLKELIGQHDSRRERFLFPLITYLSGQDASSKKPDSILVENFLNIFSAEIEKILGIMDHIKSDSKDFRAGINSPPTLKLAFSELRELNRLLRTQTELESGLFEHLKKGK